MAFETGTALVDIVGYIMVFFIHLRTIVFVAIYARECRTIIGIVVAAAAVIPLPAVFP